MAWRRASRFNVVVKVQGHVKCRLHAVIPKVLLLFYGFVLVIPPQLRSVLNMINLHGMAWREMAGRCYSLAFPLLLVLEALLDKFHA